MEIFLVGLSEAFARALARYVAGNPRVVITGVAPSLELAGLLMARAAPDIALLDWSALKDAPSDLVQRLRTRQPHLRVVCATDGSEAYRVAAALAGVDAVISKEGIAEELDSLVHRLFPGSFCPAGSPG